MSLLPPPLTAAVVNRQSPIFNPKPSTLNFLNIACFHFDAEYLLNRRRHPRLIIA
jgi:hypothetical protein